MQMEEDLGWITASEICIILHIIWKPNSVIDNIIHLKYIQVLSKFFLLLDFLLKWGLFLGTVSGY